MKRPLRLSLSVLFTLILSLSLLPIDEVSARGGRGGGGGGRGGGASSRMSSGSRGGGMQNRGNFNRGSSRSGDRSRSSSFGDRSQSRGGQGERTQRAENRQTTGQDRQTNRQTTQQDRQTNRQTTQQDRQGERTERTNTRQGERTDRTNTRQNEITNRQNNRQNFVDNNNNNNWRGGGWYGGGYNVPPGWGWAGLATGLVIGSVVATPPPYYSTVLVGSTSYLYSDGVYLEPSGDKYAIVAPPVGAVVDYLPDGCTTLNSEGVLYHNCSGIYYQAFFQNGSTVYQVVQF